MPPAKPSPRCDARAGTAIPWSLQHRCPTAHCLSHLQQPPNPGASAVSQLGEEAGRQREGAFLCFLSTCCAYANEQEHAGRGSNNPWPRCHKWSSYHGYVLLTPNPQGRCHLAYSGGGEAEAELGIPTPHLWASRLDLIASLLMWG